MKMILLITAITIQVLAFTPLRARAEGERLDKGKYEITCEGAKVTVRANDANTVELLQEFAKKSGITFNKYVGKRNTTTLDLSSVKTEEFLNRVIGSYVATSKRKNGVAQISKVTIMDEEEDTSPPPPRVKKRSKKRPPRSRRGARSSRRRKRRSKMSPRRRRRAQPPPPKPPEQSPEHPMDEPDPPEPPYQQSEDPEQNPSPQESEEEPPEF